MNSYCPRLFSRVAILSLLLTLLGTVAAAQQQPLRSITYQLSMSRPQSHLFEVAIEVELPESAPESLDFQMAKWSPGRNAVFDFAKNVQEFRAADGICPPRSLCDRATRPVTRVDDQTWRVATMNSRTLTVTYKVFGNDLSGTFSQLDARHANFNGGSVFMYIVNHKSDPVGYRSAGRMADHQWSDGTRRSARVAVSQLGHHDWHADGDRSRLDS